ncbi:TonB-dependent receptor [Congregibacter litoralis]|uniref:Outer membrane receptor protein, mostly Fe transport n=1 Tax=Congregibacter litoralis KT71 TaxID=314285 RepID=A4A3T2_9GAMM|nr:TonB-dependent receptor [Congregibacter litoralis]EAQ99355.1 Outer membrane receptor protein, mostly Fe transport [Congregibacter litoralis KT71]
MIRIPLIAARTLFTLPGLCAAALVGPAYPALAQSSEQAASRLEQVIVSASREPETGLNLALPWARIDEEALELTGAVHINQIMQRAPGAWISRGNGQESLIALRSPVLTGSGGCGAFYTAWDGISLRAPGFCNVNQLFDVNSEQAGAIEVIRGPGTAVYGANAVHGVINTLTADPRRGPENAYAIEAGPDDYYRVRGEFRARHGDHAVGAYFNGVSDGGYKDNAGFDQQKLTLRHDFSGEQWKVTNALETTNLNQETSGFVAGFEAYKDPDLKKVNPNPEAYRDSFALRAYSRWERDTRLGQLDITPYFRRTTMEFLQHFLPWQATEKNGQESLGLRVALSDGNERFRWSTGVDIDATRGWLREVQDDDFSPNQPAGIHYDYEVDALSAALYAQGDWQLTSRWGLAAGLRLEQNSYDYNNQTEDGSACAPEASACRFFRPADREDDFNNGSVNLGLTYALSDSHRVYLRGAQGFRPPQAAELYRLQSGQEVADLDSETITSVDLGMRGNFGALSYDASLYAMRKEDVIFQNADRQNVSGAKTRHEGLEFSLYWTGESGWYAGVDGNVARHRYDSAANLLGSRLDIEGNDIDTAPRHFGSARFGRDLTINNRDVRAELEWVHMGSYYLEPDNQHEYEGHELLNLRVALDLNKDFSTTLRVTNLLDEDYAERADFGFGSYRYFVGQPRGVFLEFAYRPQ